MTWHAVDPGTASAARFGHTIAGIGNGSSDGEPATLRVGTWPNVTDIDLRWSAQNSKWISDEIVLVTQQDAWAMDIGNRKAVDMLDWSFIDNPVPFGKAYGVLAAALDLSAPAFNPGTATGVVDVGDTTSPHSQIPFAVNSNASYLQIRDNFITYTGRTASTLTGCAVIQGARDVVPAGEYAFQGYVGGFGLVADKLNNVDLLYAAGLHIQERLSSLMNNGPGNHQFQLAPYWFQYNPSDGTIPVTTPPTGGIGPTAALTGTSGALVGDAGERPFFLTANEFSDWPTAAPTKRFLVPKLVGKMAAGSIASGEILDTKLVVRWAS